MRPNNESAIIWKLSIKPREWQKQAIRKWLETYSGVISVVTGGGKTLFAFYCISEFFLNYPHKGVIIVVPTLTLLDQWSIGLKEDFQIMDNEIAVFSSQEKSKNLKKYNIVLLNTARKYLPSIIEKENYFLIVDECHRAGSTVNSKALVGGYAAKLGLSATPKREYDDGFERYIKPNLGDIIYEYDYKSALHDGIIAPFELMNIQTEFIKAERDNYLKINKKLKLLLKNDQGNEESPSKADSIKTYLIRRAKISSTALMRIPVTVKIVEKYANERLIIFHENIQAANEIAALLKKRDYPVTIYHSGIPPVIRRNNLQMYKRGIYNVLVTCKALDEGMNVPETTVAIISSSTTSVRQRVQRLGRVLRPAKGKEKALIYTLYITDPEKNRLIEEYKYLEDEVDIKWLKAEQHG